MQVGALLEPGEHLVWTGAPGTKLFLSRRQGVSIAVLGVYGLIIAPLILLAFQSLIGVEIVTFLLAALVGLSLVVQAWRFWTWWVRRYGEHYVLTDQRVLVIERNGSLRSQTSLLQDHRFHLTSAPGARTTIVMGQDEALWTPSSGRTLQLKPAQDAPRLSGLDDGAAVFALIQKTAANRELQWAASANTADG